MSKETKDFIKLHENDVISATKGTGLFPSVKMAQMIIESSGKNGIGKGITAIKANNYFGIKADKNYKGEKMAFNTPKDGQPINYFRVYKTPLDSIKDHSKFLIENSRYKKAGVFNANTPEEQIKSIAKAGYAEAGKYDEAIIKMINAYNLKDLDSKNIKNKNPEKPKDEKNENKGEVFFKPLTTIILTTLLLISSYLVYNYTIKNKIK